MHVNVKLLVINTLGVNRIRFVKGENMTTSLYVTFAFDLLGNLLLSSGLDLTCPHVFSYLFDLHPDTCTHTHTHLALQTLTERWEGGGFKMGLQGEQCAWNRDACAMDPGRAPAAKSSSGGPSSSSLRLFTLLLFVSGLGVPAAASESCAGGTKRFVATCSRNQYAGGASLGAAFAC